MSIVRSQENDVKVNEVVQDMLDTKLDEPETVQAEKPKQMAPGTGIMRLNLDGHYSSDDLERGVSFSLHDFDVGMLPEGRVIVDSISTNAIGSNVPIGLTLSANLFNTSGKASHYLTSGVKNSNGWSTGKQQASLVPNGFAPIVHILPNEYSRATVQHYMPGSGVDDGLMERYGHLSTGEGLRNNIVSFPKEDYYYVAKDHVVLDIIERNWKALGQDVPSEKVRENNWVKVSKTLVEKVLDELNSKVLQNMPLTDLSALKFMLKTDRDSASHLDADSEYPLSINLSVSYRALAPELSEE